MRKSKTLLALILALIVCMTAACSGGQATPTPTPTPTTAPTEAPTPAPTDAPTTAPTEAPATPTAEPTAEPTTAPAEEIKVITIAEALELCGEPGNITADRYYIRGTVEKMINSAYGNMVVADATGSITVYGTYSADGSLKYSEMTDKAFEGDEVLLHCILQNYNGTKEVKNARLIEFKKAEVVVDDSKYTDMSIAEIRNAAVDTLVKVDGVVAAITYANGQVPNGVILVDNTQSIYVFDSNLAQQVSVGNTVTILGTKAYWILEKEMSSAEKFGYKGCCQITDVVLVSNDKQTTAYDKSWITESTVKAIMDTPVTEDITTTIYKVNALVKKVEGTGFTNYYFFDLDGETGSYTYTQCNGSDFAWLDQYDGKICTVYLTALNAKSAASGCFFRLYPVEVIDEGFQFDVANTAKHVVDYYGVGQFTNFYSGNPETELITKVSSELLGFTDATLSYASDNANVVSFYEADGKVTLNCLASGTATITVTGYHNGISHSETITVTVEMATADAYDYITVGEAVSAEKNTEVTVKGIVGPSLVNKDGFYLIDETGVIAVQVSDAATLADLEIGHEVILKGTRDVKTKGGADYFGQSNIYNAEVLTNLYGSHEYSTATFDSSITLTDFYSLDPKVDYTTKVYVLKATVTVNETAYYTNIDLYSGDTKVSLYCSSANQYSWLKEFAGQEVTIEIAPCNWNDKKYYRGCVLAVYTENGKVLNTLNFDNN